MLAVDELRHGTPDRLEQSEAAPFLSYSPSENLEEKTFGNSRTAQALPFTMSCKVADYLLLVICNKHLKNNIWKKIYCCVTHRYERHRLMCNISTSHKASVTTIELGILLKWSNQTCCPTIMAYMHNRDNCINLIIGATTLEFMIAS